MIPLSTDRVVRVKPWVTAGLILVNLAVFLFTLGQVDDPAVRGDTLVEQWIFVPHTREWWRYVTSAFLHADWMHIALNMVFLWVFGAALEDRLGRVMFLILYFAGAVAAAFMHGLSTNAPALGASGAVAALCGCYLMLFPLARVRLLFLIGFMGVIEVPAWWIVLMSILRDGYSLSTGSRENIGFAAHLGGYALGIAAGIFVLATKLVERDAYDMFALLTRIKRRHAFRSQMESVTRAEEARKKVVEGTTLEDPELAARRAEVSGDLARGDVSAATAKFVALQERARGRKAAPVVFPAKAQLVIANALLAADRPAEALAAYEGFINAYPLEGESGRVRLMGALLATRRLGDPARARVLLRGITSTMPDAGQHALAEELREEIRGKLGAEGV
ncbi:hypothetical protein BH11PLA1_BH11PLA1_06020 [soil metagenome]